MKLVTHKEMKDTTAIILVGGKSKRFGSPKWKQKFNNRTFLEITIDRVKKLADKFIISVHDINQERTIKQFLKTIDTELDYNFIHDNTSILHASGPLKGIKSVLTEINTKYAIFQSIDYPFLDKNCLNSLIETVRSKPVEIVTFLDQRKYFTSTIFSLNLSLTSKRLPNILKIKDPRLTSFYRSSLNTSYFQIPQTNSRFYQNVNTQDDLIVSDQFDSDFIPIRIKDLRIVRPGRHYQAFKAMSKNKSIEKLELRKQLEFELEKWNDIYLIKKHILRDIKMLN